MNNRTTKVETFFKHLSITTDGLPDYRGHFQTQPWKYSVPSLLHRGQVSHHCPNPLFTGPLALLSRETICVKVGGEPTANSISCNLQGRLTLSDHLESLQLVLNQCCLLRVFSREK